MMHQAQGDQGLLIMEASRSNPDTPHSTGLLSTGDQPDTLENTQKQHLTDFHARGGIQIRNPSKQLTPRPLGSAQK